MNSPRHRSHFAAARATSATSLRLAHRSTPTTAQISARSPADNATHHAGGPLSRALLSISNFTLSFFILPQLYRSGGDSYGPNPKDFLRNFFTICP